MTATTNIRQLYLKYTGLDGRKLYTPNEWISALYKDNLRCRHQTDDTVPTGTPWDAKEPEIRQDFIGVAETSAIEIITKGEFNTDRDTIKTYKQLQLIR